MVLNFIGQLNCYVKYLISRNHKTMKNPILDDHLIAIPKKVKDKKKSKFKRPQSQVLIGFGRFFIAQAIMMLFITLFVNALYAEQEKAIVSIFTMIILIIAAFLTIGIVGYNIVMGLENLTKDKILNYGDGTLGGIVIILLIFATIIISIFILYRDDVDMWAVLSSIPILLIVFGLRWIYDEIAGNH